MAPPTGNAIHPASVSFFRTQKASPTAPREKTTITISLARNPSAPTSSVWPRPTPHGNIHTSGICSPLALENIISLSKLPSVPLLLKLIRHQKRKPSNRAARLHSRPAITYPWYLARIRKTTLGSADGVARHFGEKTTKSLLQLQDTEFAAGRYPPRLLAAHFAGNTSTIALAM